MEEMKWLDTGIEVAVPELITPKKSKAGGLTPYPQELNRSYVSDHDEIIIPSPDGNPARQRILYAVSHTINGKSRQLAIYEIPAGGSIVLASAPPELAGRNVVPGNAVQPSLFAIEVQRPGRGPEWQARLMAAVERDDKTAWTFRLIWLPGSGDLPFWWARRLPGQ